MTRRELAQRIFNASYITGSFKLRSGLMSTEYFDKYRFESQPQILQAIAKHLAPMIPPGTESLAGLEMGGIPIATALSLETGLPCLFVRKKAKDYGTEQLAEGLIVQGKRICLIEDVITTGGQVVLSTKDLRALGGLVNHVLCVIYRGSDKEPRFSDLSLQMTALFNMDELKKA